MKLYHGTQDWRLTNIFKVGLKPSRLGIIYLAPSFEEAKAWGDGTVIEVNTEGYRLTSFEDCSDWEVLLWTNEPIPSNKLKEFSQREVKGK